MNLSTEKLSLKWNDFQENLCLSVKELKGSVDFSDVTLACDDDEQIEAHKVILAGSSPFFKNILTKNVHPHPFIFLRGLKYSELNSLINFIYYGEVSIAADELDKFLSIAEEFQLKGLADKNFEFGQENQQNQPHISQQEAKSNKKKKSKGGDCGNDGVTDRIPRNRYSEGFKTSQIVEESLFEKMKREIVNENHDERGDIENSITEDLDHEGNATKTVDNSYLVTIPENSSLDETISTLMEAQDGQWACNFCGKQMKRKKDMMNHTEVHIGGITHPCSSCGKAFR